MIAEWIEHMRAPAPAPLKRMGYVREQIAMRARRKRCAEAWAEHEEKCRAVIGAGIAQCRRRRRAVVFGSGPLLEIPLRELSESFENVVLVDIVHLPRTRRIASQYDNVAILDEDLTGVVESFYALVDALWTGFGQLPLPESHPNLSIEPADFDLAVSANVLSQLTVAPLAYINRRLGKEVPYSDDAIENWVGQVIAAHLDYLHEFQGVVSLLTDVSRTYLDCDGRQIDEASVIPEDRLPAPGAGGSERWRWRSAPIGEISKRYAISRDVIGIPAIAPAKPALIRGIGGTPSL